MAQLLLTGTSLSASSNLDEALLLLEARLAAWVTNAEAYNALLLQVFGAQSSDATTALQTSLSGSGLGISLQILDGATLSGINGAYTSAAPDGAEVIYLNAAWLQSATAAEIEAVLLEEIGHAIDTRLAGAVDTAGDEGEVFSALLRGLTPSSSAYAENDQNFITLAGTSVLVEAAADTTAPTGSLFPTFAYAAPSTNPFGITGVGGGGYASPALADADADGDLDLFIGNLDGNTLVFINTAAAGASAPDYAAPSTNPFGISDVVNFASPALADADRDGDLDLFIGNVLGNTLFFRNTAAAGASAPAYAAPSTNPFGITSVGSFASPAFADADGDGDLDLFIGNTVGNTLVFINTAAAGASAPAYAAPSTNPFGITDVGSYAKPELADADGDGDLDLFIGNNYDTLVFINTAAAGASAPAYAAPSTNPFGITSFFGGSPAFADADADGDLDLFIGNYFSNTEFFRNTAPTTPVAPVNSTTANGTYGIGDVITLTIGFSEAVLVDTTGGTPTLKLETGAVDSYATYSSGSGSNTLSFTYTVQAGDTSADLDQFSSTALTLNGGTIADAAGNNAILTLAAPGAAGSLGANAQLVIDGIAPTGSFSDTIATNTGLTTTISSGGLSKDNTLGLAGTYADAGSGVSTVEIYDGDTNLGLATLNNDAWSFTTAALTDGSHSFTAKLIDTAGNTLTTSPAVTATVDATAPTGSFSTTIATNTGLTTTISSGGLSKDNTLGLAGTYADAGSGVSTVEIYDGDTNLGLATLNNDAWSFTTAALTDGSHSFTAKLIDTAGNTLTTSPAVTATVDATAPTGSFSDTIATNTGLTTTISSGGLSKDNTLGLAGTYADAGSGVSSVEIYDGDTNLGLATLNNDAWSFTTAALTDGSHSFTAKLIDTAGNTLTTSPAVTATVDATAPTGALGSYATAPAYAAPSTNPFGISDVGSDANPVFADADGDGDQDLFIGNSSGNTLFFRNTAAAGASAPAYAARSTNPFGISNVGYDASPAFADADGDGDLDLFIGSGFANTFFFRNTAAAGASAPAYAAPSSNSFGIGNVGPLASPAFADADGDGDLDLFIGNNYGNTLFFRNTAAAGASAPAYAAPSTNPFGISGLGNGSYAKPELADADADGDLDLFIGNKGGITYFFRNTAAAGASAPAYAAPSTNPFGISDVGNSASPAFADADGDGDLDLFIGNRDGNTLVFINTATTPVAPVNSTTANGTYGIGDVITLTIGFSEAVLVDTTGGTPTLKLETGAVDRFATYSSGSGSNILSFAYMVRAGDTSADLDQFSANALTLNGGSIADAAGNNAILTLAAPGAAGSLGANAQLVIDGIAPTGSFSTTIDTDTGLTATISSGGLTKDNTLGLAGTYADAGSGVSSVEIYDGDTNLGLATLNNDAWSFTTSALTDGSHSFTAKVIDTAGNTLTTTPAVTATVDATAPTGSFSTTIDTDTGLTATISSGGLSKDNTLGLAGTYADAGSGVSSVEIYDGDTNLGLAILNNDAWSFTTAALTDGSHSFTAKLIDTAGNTLTTTPAVTATVDATAPTGSFSTTIDTDTGLTATISSGGLSKDNTLGLAGTYADAGSGVSSVEIYDGDTKVGDAILNNDAWSFTTSALTDGSHSFTANVIDTAGNTLTTTPAVTATVDTVRPTLGVSLSTAILSKGSTSTVTFTFSEVPVNFSLANVSATCGIFSALTTMANSGGKIFTATLTPPADTSGPKSVLSVDTNWSDAAGNAPAATATATYTVSTGSKNVVITGTDSANTLTGSNGPERIFGLGGNDILSGKGGDDTINGGAGNDWISGGVGKDILTGGPGTDTFDYTNISDSRLPNISSTGFDVITDFAIGTDRIDGPNSVSATQLRELGSVSALTGAAIGALLTTSNFVANGAATFTYGTGLNTRTFLALNDASRGFSAGSDGLVEITGYTGSLTDLTVI